MKRMWIALWLAASALGTQHGIADPAAPAPAKLVWCGLDYTWVRMIGSADFRQPQNIFPKMLDSWNMLFLKEMTPKLAELGMTVYPDTSAVRSRNRAVGPAHILRQDGPREAMVLQTHISQEMIASAVRGYSLSHGQGLGLVFIIDRLVKMQQEGCLYIVFFDVASRRILHCERVCEQAGGGGFRNYWFRPAKGAVKRLPSIYKRMLRGR